MGPKTKTSKELLDCSFCGKSQKAVAKLIAGPGVYICDECVGLCNEILDERSMGSVVTVHFPELDGISDEALGLRARMIAASVSHIDEKLREIVLVLRARGYTWQKIGESLGTTRQAAWERFSEEE